jgi:hypothetical protein
LYCCTAIAVATLPGYALAYYSAASRLKPGFAMYAIKLECYSYESLA